LGWLIFVAALAMGRPAVPQEATPPSEAPASPPADAGGAAPSPLPSFTGATSDKSAMDIMTELLGLVIYGAQGITALYGVYCAIVVIRRISQARFRNEDAQNEFLVQLEQSLSAGDFQGAAQLCEGDSRVLPQLALLALNNLNLGYSKIRHLVADRFQRDLLTEIEHRLSWVGTVIKTAPMLGLFGTVGGMMGAFDELAAGDKIDPAGLASNISLALVTTVVGLAIAIPLMLVVATINVRVRKLEDQVGLGLTQFLEVFKAALERSPRGGV
jgi:biopolymer transport protein ExbB